MNRQQHIGMAEKLAKDAYDMMEVVAENQYEPDEAATSIDIIMSTIELGRLHTEIACAMAIGEDR